jgi:mono/diheme cytochrome c family protein
MKTSSASWLVAGLLLCGADAYAQADGQIQRGRDVYQYWCATCHGPGIGNYGVPYLPGTNALRLKYKGEKPALLEERTDLTPELVAYFVRNGVSIMPPFRKVEVSDDDLKAIGAYLTRNNDK